MTTPTPNINGPDGLPADPTARLDQIHANVTSRLKSIVNDTAVTLRVQAEEARPEQVAQAMAGHFMQADHSMLATLLAAAVVLLGQHENRDTKAPPLPMPTEEDSFDTSRYEQRARDYCHGLIELMFRHGLTLSSVLDITLFDPVAGVDVAQGLHFDRDLIRYQCAAIPPQEWTIE